MNYKFIFWGFASLGIIISIIIGLLMAIYPGGKTRDGIVGGLAILLIPIVFIARSSMSSVFPQAE